MEQNYSYYLEYCRVFTAHKVLTSQIDDLKNKKGALSNKMKSLQKALENAKK